MTNPFGQQPAQSPAGFASQLADPFTRTAPSAAAPQTASDPFGGSGGPGGSFGDDEFGAPAPQADRPKIRDMEGRLLLVMPTKIERGIISRTIKRDDGTPAVQDRMTVDVVILDGGALAYGGDPFARQANQRRPHNKQHDTPWLVRGAYVSNTGLLSQCADALHEALREQAGQPRKGPKMVLGRLYQGEATNNPQGAWLLSVPTPDEQQLARQWLAANPRDPFAS